MSMKTVALLGVAIVVFAFATAPVYANSTGHRLCADHDTLTGKLESKYKEQRTGMGLVGSTGLVEVYTGESGSWTIIVTKTDGTACIVAAGDSWTDFARKPKLSGL
jgi:hypothetical protein